MSSDRPDHSIHNGDGDQPMHPAAHILFGWVASPLTKPIVFWGLGALAVLLILVDLIYVRHTKFDIEGIPGFYGIFGFLAFSFVVLMGWPLGYLLRRDENYYEDQPAETDPHSEEAQK